LICESKQIVELRNPINDLLQQCSFFCPASYFYTH